MSASPVVATAAEAEVVAAEAVKKPWNKWNESPITIFERLTNLEDVRIRSHVRSTCPSAPPDELCSPKSIEFIRYLWRSVFDENLVLGHKKHGESLDDINDAEKKGHDLAVSSPPALDETADEELGMDRCLEDVLEMGSLELVQQFAEAIERQSLALRNVLAKFWILKGGSPADVPPSPTPTPPTLGAPQVGITASDEQVVYLTLQFHYLLKKYSTVRKIPTGTVFLWDGTDLDESVDSSTILFSAFAKT